MYRRRGVKYAGPPTTPNSNPMFVRPLSAVGSAPSAAAAAWRQWYWRSTFPLVNTRNPFTSPRPSCHFTRTELPSTGHPRHLHLSSGLMKQPDSEPPVKRRKSLKCERSGGGVQRSGEGVQRSGEGVQPSGERVQPSGEGVPPSGGGVQPSGGGVPPSGGGVQPSGGGVQPSGECVPPSGGGVQPSGEGVPPSGGGVQPSGEGVPPSGGGVQPSGGGVPPSGGGVQPSGGGVQPSGGGVQPSGGGVQPSGGGVPPSGEGVQPSPKRSSSRERRESGPAWLHKVPEVPPGESSPSLIKKELTRRWENLTESCISKSVGPFDFSVMSYNILSQELLLSNTYLYKHCHPRVLEWHHRFPNLIQELEQHAADIMCLQEVQEDHYQKQIKPSLEHLGYHCEYKRRTGNKLDGCMVAFKKSRFTLFSSHPVEFFRQGIPILDRDNVGLIVVLKPVGVSESDRNVCVVTTHLLYNPRRGDIKLAQLALLLAEIGRVARQDDGTTCPILLCGDFNSVPSSPLYSFITDRKLKYVGIPIGKVSGQEVSPRGQRILNSPLWPSSLGISQMCQYEGQTHGPDVKKSKKVIEHTLKLTSVYSHYLKESGHREITTFHSRTAITVDYIFYSPAQRGESDQTECSATRQRGLQLLSRLALVSEAELKKVNGLPNQHHSSDHLPLIAHFRLQS